MTRHAILAMIASSLLLALPGEAAAQGAQRQVCAKNMGGFVTSVAIQVHGASADLLLSQGQRAGMIAGLEFCLDIPSRAESVRIEWTIVDLMAGRRCTSGVAVGRQTNRVEASVHGTVFNPHCYATAR